MRIKTLNLVKSNPIAGLEKSITGKQAKLAELRAQFVEIRQRTDDLGDQVSSALVDGSANVQSLEGQLFAAESRLRSLSSAIAKVESEIADLEQKLRAERDRAAREVSASAYRQLAKDLEKIAPAAAKATLEVAQIVGSLPASTSFASTLDQLLKFSVPGACGFFQGDVIDLTVKALRHHADEILAGNRPADLGQSIDQQAQSFGRPWAKAS